MSNTYFGTDGIRGRAGEFLTPELTLRAAASFANIVSEAGNESVMLGRDPRLSSPMLASAVEAGLTLRGINVVDLGVVPTPVVPLMVRNRKAAGGVMITASHNPVPDNGLKFFDRSGLKLSQSAESAVTAGIDSHGQMTSRANVPFGSVSAIDATEDYIRHVFKGRRSAAGRRLKVVLDTAYGAASELAPLAVKTAGHDVIAMNSQFDGQRINVRCGATDLTSLSNTVVSSGSDVGLAFDGDGDRVLAVDHEGIAISGDKVIALFATRLQRYRREREVVMTHMTNRGVELALNRHGIHVRRTEVGDIKVLNEMRLRGLHLGGEQSGHIILRDLLPTGDGIAAAISLLRIAATSAKPLADLVSEFSEFPQILTNISIQSPREWKTDRTVASRIRRVTARYKDVRFYLRPSGTEPLLRVLTEAPTWEACREANQAMCDILR